MHVVDRLLERTVVDPATPTFYRTVEWLQAAEARLDSYRNEVSLRVVGVLKAKLRR